MSWTHMAQKNLGGILGGGEVSQEANAGAKRDFEYGGRVRRWLSLLCLACNGHGCLGKGAR